jgi:hypothetical protein
MQMLASLEISISRNRYMDILIPPDIFTVQTGFIMMLLPLEVHTLHHANCAGMLALGLRFCGFRTETTGSILIYQINVQGVTLNLCSILSS